MRGAYIRGANIGHRRENLKSISPCGSRTPTSRVVNEVPTESRRSQQSFIKAEVAQAALPFLPHK